MTTTTAKAPKYRVRPAVAAEFGGVGRLTFEGFGHHFPGEAQPSPERCALLLNAAARNREGILLVAENVATGELAGTATLLPHDSALARQAAKGEIELRFLAVLTEARRSGIGSQLLEESINLSIASGARRMVLEVGLENERAQELYRRFGFVSRPERERLQPASLPHLVVYALDLPKSS